MATLETNMDGLSLNDRLEQAVKAFETKQGWSNAQWVAAKAREADTATTEKERNNIKDILARGLGFESWLALTAVHNLNMPSDILELSEDLGQRCGGTSTPISVVDREEFLHQLHTAINDVFVADTPQDQLIPLPEEYVLLLSITDGIRDNDLRKEGVCGIDGLRGAEISKMARDHPDHLPWGGYLWKLGWNVGTGFIIGQGNPADTNFLVYFYCAKDEQVDCQFGLQPYDEVIEPSERVWKWRLFYKEKERFRHSFRHAMLFDGIIDWLQWYQEWWDRESRVYVEWMAENLRLVEILYPNNPDQVGEDGYDGPPEH